MHEPPDGPPDDAATAFEAMRRQLALLASAVEGFAARQESIAARDYAPDLARLIDLQDQMAGAINTLARRPGVALTPETMAAQIETAAVTARRSDREALAEAIRRHSEAAIQLDGMIGRARIQAEQRDALIWAWLFGVITVMAVVIIPEIVAFWRS